MRILFFLLACSVLLCETAYPQSSFLHTWSSSWEYTISLNTDFNEAWKSQLQGDDYYRSPRIYSALIGDLEEQANSDSLRQLMALLFQQSVDGKLAVYAPDPLGRPSQDQLSGRTLDRVLHPVDTTYQQSFNTTKMIRTINHDQIGERQLSGIGFDQEWLYDQQQHRLLVRPTYTALKVDKLDPVTGDLRGVVPLFYNPHQTASRTYAPDQKQLIDSPSVTWASRFELQFEQQQDSVTLQQAIRYKPLEFPCIQDCFAQSAPKNPEVNGCKEYALTEVDMQPLKSTINQTLGMILFREIQDGNLRVYADEHFQQPLTVEAFNRKNTTTDTLYEECMGSYTKFIVVQFEAEDVVALRVRQVWAYNAESQQLQSIISSARLLACTRDEITGEINGFRTLGWIRFPS